MFIQNLNIEQQSALLYLCKKIIKIDDEIIDEQEAMMLQIIQSQCDANAVDKELSKEKIQQLFLTEREKCSLILELLGIAYANQDYHPNQVSFVAEYADLLGVSKSKIEKLESWVKEQLTLMNKIELVMQE